MLSIFNDQNTLDDLSDDELVGSFEAHNNVTSSSNGKWEDGIYNVLDQNEANMHPDEYEADGTTLQDSENGRYGVGGIFRVEAFEETTTGKTRTGMGIHAGRENKDFESRKTLGCIRTTPEAIEALKESINNNGAMHSTIVKNNRASDNSNAARAIVPGVYFANPNVAIQDNTLIRQPIIF